MTYVVSDLHGCYDLYQKLLDLIDFKCSDCLFVLGDVIDRGEFGIRILLDMMNRPNIIPLMGNHEYYFYQVLRALNGNITENGIPLVKELYAEWITYNGGKPTVEEYKKLSEQQKSRVYVYLGTFSYYLEIEVGNNSFFLSHAGIGNFDLRKTIAEYTPYDFIECRLSYDKVYFPDRYLVSGHTPTELIDSLYSGKIYQKNRHIALDCGAVFGKPLGCLCLDTMREYYVK